MSAKTPKRNAIMENTPNPPDDTTDPEAEEDPSNPPDDTTNPENREDTANTPGKKTVPETGLDGGVMALPPISGSLRIMSGGTSTTCPPAYIGIATYKPTTPASPVPTDLIVTVPNSGTSVRSYKVAIEITKGLRRSCAAETPASTGDFSFSFSKQNKFDPATQYTIAIYILSGGTPPSSVTAIPMQLKWTP